MLTNHTRNIELTLGFFGFISCEGGRSENELKVLNIRKALFQFLIGIDREAGCSNSQLAFLCYGFFQIVTDTQIDVVNHLGHTGHLRNSGLNRNLLNCRSFSFDDTFFLFLVRVMDERIINIKKVQLALYRKRLNLSYILQVPLVDVLHGVISSIDKIDDTKSITGEHTGNLRICTTANQKLSTMLCVPRPVFDGFRPTQDLSCVGILD